MLTHDIPKVFRVDLSGAREILGLESMRDALDFAGQAQASAVEFLAAGAISRAGDDMHAVVDALGSAPVVLVLPMHVRAIQALNALAEAVDCEFQIERTPLSQAVQDNACFAARVRNETLVSAAEIVARLSQDAERPSVRRPVLYALFADHSPVLAGAMHAVQLRRTRCYVSVLPGVVLARSGARLWTLRHAGSGVAFSEGRWIAGYRKALSREELNLALNDVAEALSTFLDARPEELLSWGRLSRNSVATVDARNQQLLTTVSSLLRHVVKKATPAEVRAHASACRQLVEAHRSTQVASGSV